LYKNRQDWKKYEKDEKKLKKVLDKEVKGWYYRQADRETGTEPNLENDTETRKRKERQQIPRVKSCSGESRAA